jgi:ATP-dependent RNA circularization protein (DNA/RNA ligase family)
MDYRAEKYILPDFPRTKHLPIEPNAQRDDLVASQDELGLLLQTNKAIIEEKIDGSNCGIIVSGDYPIIRNKNHILNKNYTGNRGTPAKAQFSPIWTWFYRNKEKFERLNEIVGYEVGVYGEWMFAKHVIYYDLLPDLFIAYDIYDAKNKYFLSPKVTRSILIEAGFSVVPLLAEDVDLSVDKLLSLRNGKSEFSNETREGIYIKVHDDTKIINRYKMVRADYTTDENWNKKALVKNKVLK